MTAKQFLSRARSLDGEIDDLLSSKQSVIDEVTKVTQNYDADGAQSTKNPHKFDRLIELESLIDAKVDEQVQAKTEILKVIFRLQDERQRRVLCLYYTVKDEKTGRPLTWEQVAVELHYSWKQTRRIHAKALVEVEAMLKKLRQTDASGVD